MVDCKPRKNGEDNENTKLPPRAALVIASCWPVPRRPAPLQPPRNHGCARRVPVLLGGGCLWERIQYIKITRVCCFPEWKLAYSRRANPRRGCIVHGLLCERGVCIFKKYLELLLKAFLLIYVNSPRE